MNQRGGDPSGAQRSKQFEAAKGWWILIEMSDSLALSWASLVMGY